jgi:hypothetical protein
MIRICIASILFAFITNIPISAQDQRPASARMTPELRRQALVMEINTRVLTDEREVMWAHSDTRIAIPGSPVVVRLVGSNMVMALQFTPVIRSQGNLLVAQGQIWIENPGRGVSYYTSIQTIPMDLNEPIHYFPLGTSDASIEIILTVNPYLQ